jgi:hypothetical protein
VFGRIAAAQAALSVGLRKVVSMPNLASIVNRPTVVPNTLCEHSTWSPLLSKHSAVVRMALIPLEVAMQASPPSIAARRS